MKKVAAWLVILTAVVLTLKKQNGLAAKPQEAAAITQAQQSGVSLTVYNQNLGLVKDKREFRLGDGIHEIRFIDVASQINPTTVHLKSLTDPQGMRILEQ